MDAVAEARSAVEQSLQNWLKDGETLMATAFAADVELAPLFEKSKVVATITGHVGSVQPTSITRSGPRRTRGTRRRRPGGRNGAGSVTGEQLLTFLQADGPKNKSEMAQHFGVSRSTIAKRLDALGGQVHPEGDGGHKMWHARELAAA